MVYLLFLYGIVTVLLESKLTKVLVIGERDIKGTKVYKRYLLWLVMLTVIAMTAIILLWLFYDILTLELFTMFFTLAFYYRAYMEWRYIRETKRHKVSFILVIYSLIVTVIFLFLP